MGKKLIIKGADFSVNGMPSIVLDWQTLSYEGGGINIITTDPLFGRNTTDTSTTRLRSVNNVYIPAGGKLHIKGLRSVPSCPLMLDGCYYISDVRNNTNSNVVGTLNGKTTNYFPINKDGLQNEVVVSNTADTGYYYGFIFAALDKTTTINDKSYTLMYALEE